MRQGTRGFYAVQGGAYRVSSEQPIEIWVEGSVSTGVTPRLIIDWGDGSDDHTGCGSCKLFHSYSTVGRRMVTVTLDDRVSAFERWTFTLDVASAVGESLRIAFVQPASTTQSVLVEFPYVVEAFYSGDGPITLSCTLEIPGVASVGTWASPASHHVGFAALVIIGVPGPVYETCVAAAEDQTVTSNRTFLIQ